MIVRRLVVRAVDAPMPRPLVTSAQVVRVAPLLLIDVETNEGIVGHAYLFCYDAVGRRLVAEVLRAVAELIEGKPADPAAVRAQLAKRWRLFGYAGAAGMAAAGIDVALWDAVAQAAGQPLVRVLGGEPVSLPCYNSNGLGLIGASAAASEAVELAGEGYRAIKLRLGYATVDEDVRVARAVRAAVGDSVDILVDYNQLLDRDEGLRRCLALDGEGVTWIEEPIAHDDYRGAAEIAARIATRVQIGENLFGTHAVQAAIDARASDLLMYDLARIGGVSGWREATPLAAAAGLPLSSHLFPEVSVHLLALSPLPDRIEMVDWASPVLQEPMRVVDGTVTPSTSPGTGVFWDENAVRRYGA